MNVPYIAELNWYGKRSGGTINRNADEGRGMDGMGLLSVPSRVGRRKMLPQRVLVEPENFRAFFHAETRIW